NPQRYGVGCRVNLLGKLILVQPMAFLIQLDDEFQVMRKCPQLCSAAQLEFHSFIQVERLIKGVCLDAKGVSERRSFEERKTISDIGRIAGEQEMLGF